MVYNVTVNGKVACDVTGGNFAPKSSSSLNLCEDWLTKTTQMN